MLDFERNVWKIKYFGSLILPWKKEKNDGFQKARCIVNLLGTYTIVVHLPWHGDGPPRDGATAP